MSQPSCRSKPATAVAICGILASALGTPALAKEGATPIQAPMLRIEAGMHVSAVKRIGVDKSCSLLLTGADDKTARLWTLPKEAGAPQLVRTLRIPIGDGDFGKVYAVALDPDGKLAAVGGFTRESGDWVYLFEVETGRIVTRLGPVKNVVNHLTFSLDGRYLAAALGAGAGVSAWERQGLAEWRRVLQDDDFSGRDSYGAAFSRDGRLFVVGDDGSLRRYSRSFKREAKIKTSGGNEPYSVAVHPDGKTVAVGIDEKVAVEIYEADTLRLVHTVDTSGIEKGNLSSVAWSKDGERLYAGGRYSTSDGAHPVLIWEGRGRGGRTSKGVSSDTVRNLETCGDRIAVAAADPAFGLIDTAGERGAWLTGFAPDMRRKNGENFTVSADGARLRFGLGKGGTDAVLFDLASGRLVDASSRVDGLAPARTEGIDIKDWNDDSAPTLRGKPFKLKDYEASRSLAITPDAGRFVLGTDWYLRAYDRSGKELWSVPTPSTAWGVNIAGNGRLVVAALGDGTVRWFRLDNGREVLALFVHAKDRRWIAWTSEGYYDASERGDELIGWHQNRGWADAAEFTFAYQRRDELKRPDRVRKAIELER